MIMGKGQLPAAPSGHRILVRPNPPDDKSGDIHIPDIAKERPHTGVIIAAGLNARDLMHDHGHQIGDVIWWGKFAGVLEEWDHIIEDGKPCKGHDWNRLPSFVDRVSEWKCACGSLRRAEPVAVVNADDILCNVSLQGRIEAGEVSITRGKTSTGTTQHYLDRKDT